MRGDSPTFSFEFFPPRTTEAVETLYQTIRDLESYMPHFVSVTYGAGGSTRDLTHDLVERIQHTTKLDPIPHLTCVCHNEEEIERILLRYAKSAIGNILALGGDRPVELLTINRGTRSNMQSIWSNSFADSMSPARIRTAAVSGSEWPAFLKGIPRRQIGCSKWITSKRK